MRIIVFRHLPDDGYESAFETVANLGGMADKPMILPGLGVAKDIYIRHHNFWHQGETMLLVTYTNEEITGEEVEIVRSQARKMLDEKN